MFGKWPKYDSKKIQQSDRLSGKGKPIKLVKIRMTCCIFLKSFMGNHRLQNFITPILDSVQLPKCYRAITWRQFTFNNQVPRSTWCSFD